MPAYAGRKGVVYMSTSGSGVASSVVRLNKWNINRTTDKHEVTSFGDTNKTYVQGLPDVKGTFSGFFDDAESKPFIGAKSANGILLYLYPSADVETKYWCGPAWLDCSMEDPVNSAVIITGDFAANGSWTDTF